LRSPTPAGTASVVQAAGAEGADVVGADGLDVVGDPVVVREGPVVVADELPDGRLLPQPTTTKVISAMTKTVSPRRTSRFWPMGTV